MENNKNFHEIVIETIKSNNHYKEYIATFDVEAFMESKQDKAEMLKAFGSLSFMYGEFNELLRNKAMGLLPTKNEIETIHKKQLKQRLEACGLKDFVLVDSFIKKVSEISLNIKSDEDKLTKFFDKLQEARESIKAELAAQPENIDEIYVLLSEIFIDNAKLFSIGMDYVESLNETKTKIIDKTLTYHDFMLINSFMFENLNFDDFGKVQVLIDKLYKEELGFGVILDEAATRYENQKAALLYYDGFVNLLETVAVFDKPQQVIVKNIGDDKCDGYNIKQTKLAKIQDETEEENDKPSLNFEQFQVTSKDNIHIYMYKTLFNVGLQSLTDMPDHISDDFISGRISAGVKTIFDSEHRGEIENGLTHAFKTKPNATERHKWGHLNLLAKEIKQNVKDLNSEFEKNVKLYMSEIPKNIKDILVKDINGIINILIVDSSVGAEVKGMLLEQLNDNKIHTFKQLNQFMEVLERCKVNCANVNVVVDFNTYLKDEKNEIIDKLGLSIELNKLQDKLNYYLTFTKYLKMFTT